MIATSLSPLEIIRWFEETDRQHEILCRMITANPRHRAVLANLARNHVDTDAALGKKVAFVMFGGTPVRNYQDLGSSFGKRVVIPGEFVLEPVTLVRSRFQIEEDVWDGTEQRSHRFDNGEAFHYLHLAKKTAAIADEWMAVLKVDRKALPVLCALVRGGETVVIPLGKDVCADSVLKILGRLADIAQRQTQPIIRMSYIVEERLKLAVQLEKKLGSLQVGLTRQLDVMCNRFEASQEQRDLVIRYLAANRFTEETLERLFSECNFEPERDDFALDRTVLSVRKRISQIEQTATAFLETMPEPAVNDSLSRGLQDLMMRRRETTELIRELQQEGVGAKSLNRAALGAALDNTSRRAKQIGGLVEKLAKLWTWAKKTAFIAHLLG